MTETTKADGFEVYEFSTGGVVRFVECSYGESMRERVEMGLLRNMNAERYGVRDTRWDAEAVDA